MSDFKQMEHIKSLLSPYRKKICIIVILMLVISGISILIPFCQQRIVDEGILKNDVWMVVKLILCIIALYVFGGIITVLQNILQADISLKIAQKLEADIFNRALKLKFEYIQEHGIYKIVKDVDRYVQSIMDLTAGHTIQIFVELFKFFGILIALLILNWKATLYLLAIIPLRLLITKILSNYVKINSEKSCLIQKYIHRWEEDIYNSFLQIKLWNLIELKTRQYNELLFERNRKVKNHFFITGVDSSISNNFLQIVINSLYLFCGIFVINNEISIGTMFAFVSYSVYLLEPISLISYLKIIISKIKPEFEIYKDFCQLEEDHDLFPSTNFPHDTQLTLSFKNVSFKYDEKLVIDNLNFEIKTGDIVALVGENGSGKSTIIDLILRLYKPSKGRIYINGIDIENIYIESYRDNISIVLQSDDLFMGTVKENLTVYDRYRLPEELLNKQLFQFIYKYAEGVNTKIESKSSGVSGGEKQKIALLRSLNKSARILLLDEPTSNYDQESEDEFLKIIRELQCDIIIIASHSKKILEMANKVIRLSKA